ncbi:YTH domain-containing protein ECT3-like [Argentina anserina]|uniref:YTH domain-containing protein ECT3-like n=1 Tax=Argentina anserina TaxID=57926 RepID=UPI0021767172|nr:YTH domain-containing protein ECT3-like [Potentilla anserina]XP_050372049.1 YTH domain-containing protein ECT3-like [Potentilla anserina]
MYNVPEHVDNEVYMIQGMEPNMHYTTPYEQVDAMYNEGAPEYVVDQGMYYPTANNYGYYCTGFESPGEWEDQCRIFGADGPDLQYMGVQNESFPYVYYPPGYGYAQTSYNPYNPYIPGAMIGVDGQQYYTIPSYQNSVSSPSYVPFVQPDVIPNNSPDSFYDTGTSINRTGGRGLKYNLNSASGAFPNTPKTSSNQISPLTRLLERPRDNVGPNKQAATHGSISSGRFPNPAYQSKSASGSVSSMDNLSNGKVLPHHNQLKVAIPVGNGLSDFGSGAQGRDAVAKLRPKFHVGRAWNDIQNVEQLSEQNCGPRISRPKNQLAVKAYTTQAGDCNAHGNIIICMDQYNKDNLPVDYVHAKFFVIKSYSEDDVHKSVKYNVWSSTPHGNKKLSSAYEDAQRRAAGNPGGCPIFLFFSVNASGQFCGVAEMVGPVDFNKDMDFWQQDKWSGSFPVKWHIVKDVPNTSARHIVLENNENKPVTNSRDTQEIMYKKGLEMLKVFKNHTMKTSLLDDFMYYEDRQKIMQDERGRYHVRNFETPFVATALGPPRRVNPVRELPRNKEEKDTKFSDAINSAKSPVSASDQISSDLKANGSSIRSENSEKRAIEAECDAVSTLKIGSLTIDPKQVELDSSAGAATDNSKNADVVTVGSIPVRVNGFAESLGTLTVGTIPLDPRALKLEKGSFLN